MEAKRLLSESTHEQIFHCNKCGLCMAACPVYKEVLLESASPRGKVQLTRHVLEGGLDLSPRMREILSRCLMCGSCVPACPSGVHGDRLFSGMRWRATQRYGIDWRKRVLFQILSHKWMTSGSARVGRWARGLFGRWVEEGRKVGNLPLERMPAFSAKPFSREAPEVVRPVGEVRGKLLYFHGCATEYLYGEVGRAVISVLPQMGLEVHIPRGQGCCGVPIFLSGAREISLESIRAVLNLFAREDVDAVIVDCATCGMALRREYAPLLQELKDLGEKVDEDLVTAAQLLAARTQDVIAYVGEHMEWLPEMAAHGERVRVTYHDPCHLLKGQGVGILPRRLLQRLPNVEFVEMEGADACCGGGGSFQVEHPEVSAAITARKVESIQRAGAEVVATGCPGCRLTIAAHLGAEKPIQVLHPVQLIERAMRPAST
jgi:glycolate oxidase iron-sulfur subunit